MKKKSLVSSSMLTYFILMICFVLVRIFFNNIPLPFSQNVKELIATIFVQVGLMFFVSVGLFSVFRKQKIKTTLTDFGFKKINFTPILISLFIGIMCYFLNIFIASFFSGIISFLGYEEAPSFFATSGVFNFNIYFASFYSCIASCTF